MFCQLGGKLVFNLIVPCRRYGSNFESVNTCYGISSWSFLVKLPQYTSDDKSTLVQVMAPAVVLGNNPTTWGNFHPDLCHYMAPPGLNELINAHR